MQGGPAQTRPSRCWGAQQPRSSGPIGDSEHVNLAIRPQHGHVRSTGETAVLSHLSRGRGTPGSEKGGSLNTLECPFPSLLRLSPKWAAEFSSSYVTLTDGSQKRCERNQLSAVKPDIQETCHSDKQCHSSIVGSSLFSQICQ